MAEPAIEVIGATDRAATVLNPLRLQILERLREADTAAGVARALGLPRQRVHYHVRELERAGLVETVEERRRGNFVERRIRARAQAWLIAPQALGAVGASQADVGDRFSSSYLLSMAARTIRDVAALREAADAAGLKLATFTLESEVRFSSPQAQHQFVEELTDAVADLVARHHDERTPQGRAFRFHITAYPSPATNGERGAFEESEESR
ncbi:MAG: helix-turn-helix domain-containing protein [Gemmatimonadetes bacterium]|nr:helix-turn-helix domain-containing protein [Gemmatimonadota bacterium]